MTLKIIQKGFASAVQDIGRTGYQRYGIIVGGVMDPPAAKIANWLVDNHESAAVIEYSFAGPSIFFTEDTLFAVTGAECIPMLNGREIGMGRPCLARGGHILTIGRMLSGSRGYLAVAGGVATPVWYGSRSTDLRAGCGGYEGRLLAEHDCLPTGIPSPYAQGIMSVLAQVESPISWYAALRRSYRGMHWIRVMPDTLWPHFSEESRKAFLSTNYQITASSDRMGYRLSGEHLLLEEAGELYSEAVTNGSIQVPGNGQPIILMTDHQSIGGYPRIAQVASADLSLLAQLSPGAKLRFRMITTQEGEAAAIQQYHTLKRLHQEIKCRFRLLAQKNN
ncbi:biotin-dependent carboxyltransferase family protein [Sporolactobacillus sp. CPB3-1]|uniref:Biotin-dependent carboxyltransferase family protein n=1 Tax=Sporolactobacillus mangiferae TaxID=2940498 RepID=A0ABT0M955_9BACL|nr:biotin-dependent carboxyltransferase family protein [Sporolactobacillus mangiferae]MCL1631407.1 biotin-dependent carboxyltransferase family protein [Sporolactobacillus mangiferae]